MDIDNYITKIACNSLNFPRDIINEGIFLPKEFYGQIDAMVSQKNELRGIMFYKKSNKSGRQLNYVEFFQTIGRGNSSFVKPEIKKLNASIKFLENNPDYSNIDFHTHPEILNSYYYENFSEEDKKILEKMLNKNSDYKHVLFTPTHILTFGKNKPSLHILPENEDVLSKFNQINSEYKSYF